jgi:hypothetical protein
LTHPEAAAVKVRQNSPASRSPFVPGAMGPDPDMLFKSFPELAQLLLLRANRFRSVDRFSVHGKEGFLPPMGR